MNTTPLARLHALCLGLCLLLLAGPAAAATDGWFAAHPLPGGNPLNAIDCPAAPSSSQPCIAVGWGGTILTSGDGLNWDRRDSKTVHRLYGIARDVGAIWVAGEGGVVLVSRNGGVTWDFEDTGLREALFDIAVGTLQGTRKTLVAVGKNGTILTREITAGETASSVAWTLRRPPILPAFSHVVYASGQRAFYAVGSSRGIVRSFDGVTWDEVKDSTGQNRLYSPFDGTSGADPLLSASFNAAAVGPGLGAGGSDLIVAVGRFGLVMVADTDPGQGGGLRWVEAIGGSSATGKALIDVFWDGGQFVAIGEKGVLLQSTDGQNWTESDRGAGSLVANGVTAFVDPITSVRTYLAAGYFNPAQGAGITGGIIRNDGLVDPTTWTNLAPPPQSPFNAVASLGQTVTIAVGDNGAIAHSSDGYAWQAASGVPTTANLRGVAIAPAISPAPATAYAVGADAGGAGVVVTSVAPSLGASWTTATIPSVPGLEAVSADAAGRVVTVGAGGTVLHCTSPCPAWSVAASPPPASAGALVAVAADGNGRFVATTDQGRVYYSIDAGANWSEAAQPPATSQALRGLVRAGSEFIAADAGGVFFASPGGDVWTRRTPVGTGLNLVVDGLAWSGHHLVAVGSPTGIISIASRRIHESDDGGLTFEENGHNDFVRQPLHAVAWNGRQFVAVGDGGTILGSDGLDIAVNPRLNQDPGKVLLPTTLSKNGAGNYLLTVTNNGNLSVKQAVLEIDLPPNGTIRFDKATWLQANTPTDLPCTVNVLAGVSSRQQVRCPLPVELPVVTLQDNAVQQTSQRAEGINIDVAITPLQEGPVELVFRVVSEMVPAIEDENPVNSRLAVAVEVGPEVFNIDPANPFFGEVSGGGGGGGPTGPWAVLALAVAWLGRRRRAA